MKVTEAVNRQG